MGFVKLNGHCVNGKIATVLVVFKRAVLNNGLSGIVTVALTTSTDKLYFQIFIFHLSRAKILEHRDMSLTSQLTTQSVSDLNAATNNNNVNVIGGTLKKNVTNITTDNITVEM